jgi:hypothetical protein
MAMQGVQGQGTRTFAAGEFRFAVEVEDAGDLAMVESLLRDFPSPSTGEAAFTRFALTRERADREARKISGPMLDDHEVPNFASAFDLLLSAVNIAALESEPEDLHLHAAGATRAGRAVLIAAERNSGKTTTIAHLIARGFDYLTDETVRIRRDTGELNGLSKPLTIKPGGRGTVAHLEPWMAPRADDGPEVFRFVPVSASGAAVTRIGVPHVVILLRRPETQSLVDAAPRQLHPADAVVALMQETLDAERFGTAALQLARLAVNSHCYEVQVAGTPAEIADEIEAVCNREPVAATTLSLLPPSDAFSGGVTSIGLGNRVVVHHATSGLIFALDSGGSQVWKKLGGWHDDDRIDLRGPVIGPFVAQLRELGVLAGTT